MTFRECAGAYIAAHQAGRKIPKHTAQWPSTPGTYVYPVFGSLAVQTVDVALVRKALEPIWNAKPETPSRVRGRIEAVLDWATVRGYRRGENPARWRGHLENLLPKRSKVARVEHHAALPYPEIAEFMTKLRAQEGVAARALEFAILTAARTGEVIGATWAEIDLQGRLWTIPGGRCGAWGETGSRCTGFDRHSRIGAPSRPRSPQEAQMTPEVGSMPLLEAIHDLRRFWATDIRTAITSATEDLLATGEL
jgi:Phage integrase central domain